VSIGINELMKGELQAIRRGSPQLRSRRELLEPTDIRRRPKGRGTPRLLITDAPSCGNADRHIARHVGDRVRRSA